MPVSENSGLTQKPCDSTVLLPFLKKKKLLGTAALKNGVYCFEPTERVSIQGLADKSFVTVKYLSARQIPPRLQQVQFGMTCLHSFKNEQQIPAKHPSPHSARIMFSSQALR